MSACTPDRALPPPTFNEQERRHLLASPGLGPVVVERLEQSGIVSITTLRHLGVDAVVDAMCQPGQNQAWRNRRRALLRAVSQFGQAGAGLAAVCSAGPAHRRSPAREAAAG